jgi:hypothetical protein
VKFSTTKRTSARRAVCALARYFGCSGLSRHSTAITETVKLTPNRHEQKSFCCGPGTAADAPNIARTKVLAARCNNGTSGAAAADRQQKEVDPDRGAVDD